MILGRKFLVALVAIFVVGVRLARASDAATTQPYVITVIDDRTSRGIPLVELRTTSELRFYTDSNGVAAIDEPLLMNQRVFFFVESPGYAYKADGFGFHGTSLDVSAGKSATVKMTRLNIAERLYRVTGQGIYRDTVLAGRKAPIREPMLNAQVVGQDSALAIPYQGKIFWFWGDTSRLSYALGHFGTAGATSQLSGQGGLDPAIGIDLTYFTDAHGFSRPTCDLPGEGPKWLDGLMTLKDESGHERLLAKYARVQGVARVLERGLVQWDDETQAWKRIVQFDLDQPLYPSGHPAQYSDAGIEYFYFPSVRVKADWKSVLDPSQYEAMTCLAPGTRYKKRGSQLDRSPDGTLHWGWKRDTSPITGVEEHELISDGKMKPAESRFLLHDPDTRRTVIPHFGSVCWNAFRQKWIRIVVEQGGEQSYLGEVWYAEADSPAGPWYWARKIASHPHYSLYNPVQHPFFDQEGGRVIYFEGTYSTTFSGNDHPTPLYDYNQLMYRLDLSDSRLAMPPIPR